MTHWSEVGLVCFIILVLCCASCITCHNPNGCIHCFFLKHTIFFFIHLSSQACKTLLCFSSCMPHPAHILLPRSGAWILKPLFATSTFHVADGCHNMTLVARGITGMSSVLWWHNVVALSYTLKQWFDVTAVSIHSAKQEAAAPTPRGRRFLRN